MAIELEWKFAFYNDLTLDELYDLLMERQRVFVVEQDCAFLDADGVDKKSWHLLGYAEIDSTKRLVAYSRIIPAGVTFKEASIGRIITTPEGRGLGAGMALLHESIVQLENLFGNVPIKIGSQTYLNDFYMKFGFEIVSEPYDEDGIMHVHMLRKPKA